MGVSLRPAPSVVAPPLIVLAVAAVGAGILAAVLSGALYGSFINLARVGVFAAWAGYAMFAGTFLFLDYLAVRRLADGLWPSGAAMWRQTIVVGVVALAMAVVIAFLYATLLAHMGIGHSAATGVFMLGFVGLFALAVPIGLVLDLRARRATRIAP
jgi:hypothetical protein